MEEATFLLLGDKIGPWSSSSSSLSSLVPESFNSWNDCYHQRQRSQKLCMAENTGSKGQVAGVYTFVCHHESEIYECSEWSRTFSQVRGDGYCFQSANGEQRMHRRCDTSIFHAWISSQFGTIIMIQRAKGEVVSVFAHQSSLIHMYLQMMRNHMHMYIWSHFYGWKRGGSLEIRFYNKHNSTYWNAYWIA